MTAAAAPEQGFAHLHLHSQYSLLDGAIRMEELCPRIKEQGMQSVAVTDHGNMYGAVHFFQEAKKHGVKPIFGCEAYVAGPKGRQDRTDRSSSHIILLAQNNEGYRNLTYLVSMAHLEGFYYKPRIDLDLLRKHSKGLYALSACLGGVVNKKLLKEGEAAAAEAAKTYSDAFAPGHFFLELQDNGLDDQYRANDALLNISELYKLPTIATADAHYLRPEDSPAHEILMCIGQNVGLQEFRTKHHKHSDRLYVRSPDEMWAAFARKAPKAVENTLRIAADCNVELDLSQRYLPNFAVPEGFTREQYLEKLAVEGLRQRIAEAHYPIDAHAYRERLDFEVSVINKMGFAGYFLIVWDFIRYAREHGIPVGPGRGSGAGSIVAWSLRITDLDPIPYDLLFERFMNPERVSMPDFDIDFCMNRRGEVIDYVSQRYGKDNVAQIVTYSELSAKSGIKDVGRVMGLPFAEVNQLTKLIPGLIEGKKVTIDQALELEPRLRQIQDEKPIYKEVINVCRSLEGLNRQTGIHAAGIVIGGKPIWEYVPVCRGKNGELVTQFAKDEVEAAGLIKFDFLGLKTLTVVAHAVRHIRRRTDAGPLGPNVEFAAERIPLDDPGMYDLMAAADTDGVFQLESSGFKELLKRLKPDCFEDVVAAVALYRPGPLDAGMVDDYVERKHGKRMVAYPHPVCEPILRPTYGVIVYQEQVMRIAVDLCGFSMGEADVLRKAMGKKKADVMAKMRAQFVEGAGKKSGMHEKAADELFTQIEKFAGYAFNKCLIGATRVDDALTGETTTIRELYQQRREFTVHAIGDNFRLRPRRVVDVISNGRKRVFELVTAQGHRITATANHPFLALDGWKNLAELHPGDRIATPRVQQVDTQKTWPAHELVTLAGLLSEGNLCHPTCLYFTSKTPAAVHDFVGAVQQFPATVARIDTRSNGIYQVCVSTGRNMRFAPGQTPWNAVGNLALAAEPVRSGAFRWASDLAILNKKATEKFVPARVFMLRDADLALFLGRLWAGDGFIANRTQAVPFYATSSPRLAGDVQALLLRLGIPSGIDEKRFKYRGGEKIGYTVHVVGEGARERFAELILPHCVGRDAAAAALRADLRRLSKTASRSSKDTIPAEVRRWIDAERRALGLTWRELEAKSGVCTKELYGKGSHRKRGFRRSTIARLAQFLGAQRLINIAASDIFWDTVAHIEPRGIQDTYDLTVEGDHNFVADGFIVHNSHSAAYAVISCQTAFLKRYYPVEFMAALLSTEMGTQDNVVKYIHSAREHGIRILPPDAARSDRDFSVVHDRDERVILFGLGAVKGIGDAAIDAILKVRGDAPLRSLYDFCERVDLKRVNRKVLEALIKSGACDAFGRPRSQMMEALDTALERGQRAQHDLLTGQTSLFAAFATAGAAAQQAPTLETYPEIEEWIEKRRLANEKEALGFYITGHPLDRYADDLPRMASCTTSKLAALATRAPQRFSEIALAGVISAYKEKPLKSGDGRMAFVTLEDLEGSCEVLVFSKVFEAYEDVLKRDEPILVRGQVMLDGDDENAVPKLRATSIELLAEARAQRATGIELELSVFELSDHKLGKLKDLLQAHRGDVPVRLRLINPDQFETVMRLPDSLNAVPGDELLARVDQLFGRKVVHLV